MELNNVLIIGSGGREHALAWKMSQSLIVKNVFVMPGNPGMSFIDKVVVVDEKIKDNVQVEKFALENNCKLVVIGPEIYLSWGMSDHLKQSGIYVYGPNKKAAMLETSKIFAKKFMKENDIPTAKFEVYSNYEDAISGLGNWDIKKGIAIKADELSSGKGVLVTDSFEEAKKCIYDFMINTNCTVNTKSLVIEERLVGREVSAFAVCDGKSFLPIGMICDYKRVFDGDKGANTGGMGCYSPFNWPNPSIKEFIYENIFKKTIDKMNENNMPFCGTLFAGLMIYGDDVKVIEYNVRFGDPETQTLMPLLKGDLYSALYNAAKGDIKDSYGKLTVSDDYAVHVVMASKGYPSIDGSKILLDKKITFPNQLLQYDNNCSNLLFFAGVKKDYKESLINSSGRVLGVTCIDKNIDNARNNAYKILKDIYFEGAHWRSDIGQQKK